MTSYYNFVKGNLNVGDIAKSSDINHIQLHIKDSEKALMSDLHDNESFILGSGDIHKNAFILTAAPKEFGRYVDSKNIFEAEDSFLNINRYDVRQPLIKTKTSLYSVVTKLKNTSNRDIPVTFELQDENENVLKSNTVTLIKNTRSAEYEIVFDLKYYPTAPNLNYEELILRDGQDIPLRTKEENFDEGYDTKHLLEKDQPPSFSAGVSKLYFVIKRTNLNAIDLADNGDEDIIFDPDESLGVYCQKGSYFPDKKIFAEINGGTIYQMTDKNIYYKDIYASEQTYLCTGGKAIIDGEPVVCIDTHVSIEGGSSAGNVLTQVYLDNMGHLRAANKKTSLTTKINDFVDDLDNPLPPNYLPIALILTYFNAIYGINKEPLVIQDGYGQRPRSHHERLRVIEKRLDWDEDIALPSRIKRTISDGDWVDRKGTLLTDFPYGKGSDLENITSLFVTSDENGNLVVKLTDAVTQNIPITLKENLTDSDGKEIQLQETDVLNVSSFSELQNMKHDSDAGTLTLDKVKDENGNFVSTTEEQSKLTEYNPWDDSESNRPANNDYEKNERAYTVYSGKNQSSDFSSEYPGMTFYTDSNYKMQKLTIPITKFKTCSAVKFYIFKRQESNNKTNDVWFQKHIYTSKEFSLKQSKEKGDYQYMDEGFTIEFGDGGLSLDKGQYVIIALPIPQGDSGTMFVDTYKPQNSKDFCIRYHGAANASHFLLKERYQEVWYNSATAIVSEENYASEGTAVSKTLTWTEKGLERIKTIKPIVGSHLTLGTNNNNSYEIYANTGGDWQKLEPDKDNEMNGGGATTFKWKIVFKGDGKSTPKLEYNDDDKYAIQFVLTREKSGTGDSSVNEDYDKNMCITSIPFDGDEILKEYLGDMNFGETHSRFEGYEFARVWANKDLNEKLLIDIQASDKTFNYELKDGNGQTISNDTTLWSLHYCDLTLDDFSKINVDYSNYTEELEYDENNMRLKLDSEHSYNDNDIQILALKDFTKITNDIDSTTNNTIILSNKTSVTDNQVYIKKTFDQTIDLTKYTGLTFKFKTSGEQSTNVSIDGLALYISSAVESEVPSDTKNEPDWEEQLEDTEILPKIIDPDVSSYSYYEGKVIKIIHKINSDIDGDKAYKTGYYQYVKQYNEAKGKYIYKLQQILDLRTYNIYKFGTITYSEETNTFNVRVEIDQDSNNLKHVKEMGIISLNDEGAYKLIDNNLTAHLSASSPAANQLKIRLVNQKQTPIIGAKITYNTRQQTTDNNGEISLTGLSNSGNLTFKFAGDENCSAASLSLTYDFSKTPAITVTNNTSIVGKNISLQLESVKAISEDCFTIYDPEKKIRSGSYYYDENIPKEENDMYVRTYDNIRLNEQSYATTVPPEVKNISQLTPSVTQLVVKYKQSVFKTPKSIWYTNNPYKGGLSRYKHIGIQLASDVYIPKNCLKLDICAGTNGRDVIESVNIPTLNTIYYPNISMTKINLSTIFKKLKDDDRDIKSLGISVTSHFYEYLNKIVDTQKKPAINLFLGKVTLYRAETIPIYHNKMRFKFYSTTDGEIDANNKTIDDDDSTISIRKIGAVLDYH